MNHRTDADLCVLAQTQGPGLEFVRDAAEREMVDRYARRAGFEARDFAESVVLESREDLESYALRALLDSVRAFDPEDGTPFWGYAKGNIRNRLTDRKRRSERRLDATGGPVLSLEAGEDDEEGGDIAAGVADPRSLDPGTNVAAAVIARRELAGIKARMLARYVEATGDRPVPAAAKSAIRAFVIHQRDRTKLSHAEAEEIVAAVAQESGQMVLLGLDPVAATDVRMRSALRECVEAQIALALSLAVGGSVEEAATAAGLPAPLARRLLAGLRRTLRQ